MTTRYSVLFVRIETQNGKDLGKKARKPRKYASSKLSLTHDSRVGIKDTSVSIDK